MDDFERRARNAGAEKERRRIRRAILPALRTLAEAHAFVGSTVYDVRAALDRAADAINQATNAPRRKP